MRATLFLFLVFMLPNEYGYAAGGDLNDDTTKFGGSDTIRISDITSSKKTLKDRNAIDFFGLISPGRFKLWNYDYTVGRYKELFIDSSLFLNHLNYPQNRKFESFTFLGNIGSPSQFDHFFSRPVKYDFLFGRYHSVYTLNAASYPNYKVTGPFTAIEFSNAGSRRDAEEILRAFHSQNANANLNFGIEYKFTGTKGVYQNQKTRNTSFAVFSSYCKGNFFARAVFTYNAFKNNENGGIINTVALKDTIPSIIAVYLKESTKSYSETRFNSFSTTLAYSFLNIISNEVNTKYEPIQRLKPLVLGYIHYNYKFNTRLYLNNEPQNSYFENNYTSPVKTRDSVSLSLHEVLLELEISQFAKRIGIPGLKFFSGIEALDYFYFKPDMFLYNNFSQKYNTFNLGVKAFSESDYLKYSATAKYYFFGHKKNDKEVAGELILSPWSNPSLPNLAGYLRITDSEPDVFINSYFSNHFYWSNEFEKERRFYLGGKIIFDKIFTEVGYNIEYINNYVFFNSNSLPRQDNDIAVTSAWGQNKFHFGNFRLFSKLIWQYSTKSDVISLPKLIGFTSLYYETNIVENALDGQFGFNITYRSKFYADAYNPAIGQFYNQQNKLIGNHPLVDIYVNLKWKKAILFFKYEHINQGVPDYEYYAAYRYPYNPRVFKFGVSWTFYD